MTPRPAIETMLQEAIRLLVDSGHPHAAEQLLPRLSAIRSAPTNAARQRRIHELAGLLGDDCAVTSVCFRARASDTGGVRFGFSPESDATEARYVTLLDRIQAAATA